MTVIPMPSTVRETSDPDAGFPGLRLLVIGDDSFTSHRIGDRGHLTLGRSESCDIQIADPSISRRHALLHLGQALAIEDLGSANGTRVRGRRIDVDQPEPLTAGEVVELGSVMIIVQGTPAARVRARPTAPVLAVPNLPVVGGPMLRLRRLAERIAGANISVLLLGETGVGKEVMAETIHRLSTRSQRPFLRLNCAALSESLLESELFGHERGAFTGATGAKLGLLETAQGGTVFLDEVGELPAATQVKLLRVIEERCVLPVGALKTRPIDVRFIAATNRDLEGEAARGAFRLDLFFRLNGVSLVIPPLRQRVEEIRELATEFIGAAARNVSREPPALDAEAAEMLERYQWPGNIRELRNVVERALLLCGDGPQITAEHLPVEKMSAPPVLPAAAPAATVSVSVPGGAVPVGTTVDQLRRAVQDEERQKIIDALAASAGNQTRAAQRLGIARRTLVKRLARLDIPRPRKG